MTDRGVLWVSTDRRTRGGISAYVEVTAATALWPTWRVEHLVTHVDGTHLRKAVAFGRSLARLVVLLARRRPLLAHVHTASRASFLRKAVVVWTVAAVRVPVVLHVHGGGFAEFHDGAPVPLRALVRATLRRADRVVALGDGWAERLARIAPGARIVVCPNPITVPADAGPGPAPGAGERPGEGERPRVGGEADGRVGVMARGGAGPVSVLLAGKLGAGKGVDDLLDAWAALRPVDARLTLAGDGDIDGARGRVAALGLESGVDVPGWLSRERVLAAMAVSDVFVLPSHREGQPMAVLEAMANGLCVVASRVGGIPDLLDDGVTGLLVPPADPATLAAALRRVLDDPALRTRLGAAARERVRSTHDARIVAARLDALYREVLAAHGVTDLPEPAPRSA